MEVTASLPRTEDEFRKCRSWQGLTLGRGRWRSDRNKGAATLSQINGPLTLGILPAKEEIQTHSRSSSAVAQSAELIDIRGSLHSKGWA